MKKESTIYGIIGILLGGILVWVLAINVVNNNMANVMKPMGFRQTNNSRPMMENTIDQHFIEQMIPHHEDAIVMAEIALEKAQHQEIKDLAQNIIQTQSSEIDQMEKWYTEWYETEVPKDDTVMSMHGMKNGAMHMGMMGDETDIEALRNASDFDSEFIEQMIPHHQMAVMMAQMLERTTSRDEMKKLADNIINAQTQEINEMRQWYQEWNEAGGE